MRRRRSIVGGEEKTECEELGKEKIEVKQMGERDGRFFFAFFGRRL